MKQLSNEKVGAHCASAFSFGFAAFRTGAVRLREMSEMSFFNPVSLDESWQLRHKAAPVEQHESVLHGALPAPPEYSTLWRLARMAHFKAMQSEQSGYRDETLRWFEIGKEHAQGAVESNRHEVEGHFWLGVNALEWSRRKGRIQTASSFRSAAAHIERAMNQNEEYHFAGPVRVWARITHLKPLILGGSIDRALDIYRRALQIAPHNSTTLIYYVEALLADQQKPLARQILHQIIDAPKDKDWLWEQARDRKIAQAHLAKMDSIR